MGANVETMQGERSQIDKPVFGMYLNQARLNAYIALCHISELLRESTVDEDSLTEMPVLRNLDPGGDVLKSEQTLKRIQETFPMVNIIYECQRSRRDGEPPEEHPAKAKKNILICLLKALQQKRNEYCHALHKKIGDEDFGNLIQYLEDCFDAAVRRVKEVRLLKEEDILHLRRKISQGEGKEKRVVDNLKFCYPFKDGQGRLTDKGLAFLTSLFLEKRDIFLFLASRTGFHRSDTPGYKATREVYCCYRIRIPKPVVTSDEDADGLALDILNELKKCPGELFELLPADKQQLFRVTENDDENDDGNGEGTEILLRRYSDRFPYFALRYCDENSVFPNLRFHIDLGKYYFRFYEKHTIDGERRRRALDKSLKTFGRIREVKETVQREWKDLIKTPDEIVEGGDDPYKTNTTPHYHIVNNQIGFVITPKNDLPDISASDGKIELRKPDAWLSVHELPAMLFHGLQCGFETTESLLIQYIKNQREICETVRDTGQLPELSEEKRRYLPEAFQKYRGVGPAAYAEKKLERMLEDTRKRLKAFESAEKLAADPHIKPGKRKYSDIRPGRLADFLARDILALQPFDPSKQGKDKLTSVNFQVLQATLAFYGLKKDSIHSLFQNIGLPDGENPHPFLQKLDPCRYSSIAEFFKAYLQARKAYLRACLEEKRYDDQFLRPSRPCYREGGGDVRAVASRLLESPVNIPRGFFEDALRSFILQEDPGLKDRRMNTAYMIQAWFEKQCGRPQPFYSYERIYPVVLKAQAYVKRNTSIETILQTITSRLGYRALAALIREKVPDDGRFDPDTLKENLLNGCRDFKNCERRLRQYKVQDMVLFLMVKRTLEERLAFEEPALTLEHFAPDNRSPFKRPISCVTNLSVAFNRGPEKEYATFIKEKRTGLFREQGNKLVLDYQLTAENTKLGDIGKYRRYQYDRRLKGLLLWKYPPNTGGGPEITYDNILAEIDAYERHRTDIFRRLYKFEEKAIEACGLKLGKKKNTSPLIKLSMPFGRDGRSKDRITTSC